VKPLLDDSSAAAVFEHRRTRLNPLVAPGGQRDHNGLEVQTLWSKDILSMVGVCSRGSRFQDSGLDEALETFREDVRSDAETALKVGEADVSPKEGVAKDQKAPPLANDLERSRRRTLLILI
jgi:hypothetical protein